MAQWKAANLSTLMPTELGQAIGAADIVAGTLGQALSSAASAIGVLSSLMVEPPDPLKAVIG